MYIIAVASLCFGVAMLVLYRREKESSLIDEISELEQSGQVIESDALVPPPPGFENAPPPNLVAPPGFENVPPPEATISLDFSDSVYQNIVENFGILDGANFLRFATQYDADGNGYLRQSEMQRAANEYVSSGHNQPPQSNVYSDDQLLAAGWTREQIEAARLSGQI